MEIEAALLACVKLAEQVEPVLLESFSSMSAA